VKKRELTIAESTRLSPKDPLSSLQLNEASQSAETRGSVGERSTYVVRGSRLLNVAGVERRDEEERGLLSLDLLDSVECLDRTKVINCIGTLGASLASRPGREDDGTSSLELGRELGGGSVLE
jgi:hypothetical protein